MSGFVYHFSEDDSIREFAPHVPTTNPTQPPSVWAIDEAHAPLYWFPRDCPRVTAWPRHAGERAEFERAFATTAHRVHAIETGWLDAMRTVTLFRYTFDRASFEPWPEASGQWTSTSTIRPVDVAPVGDLVDRHVAAGIELRTVVSLWPIAHLANDSRWDFSIVRMVNARRV